MYFIAYMHDICSAIEQQRKFKKKKQVNVRMSSRRACGVTKSKVQCVIFSCPPPPPPLHDSLPKQSSSLLALQGKRWSYGKRRI